MNKIYQPEIITKTNQIVDLLSDVQFFKEHEIENTDFAKKYFNEKLTEKFINGELNNDAIFSEEEMEICLKEIITGSILYQLKEKGYINSYEDDNTEEIFFLTEDGREFIKNMKDLD
jgi:hypothetical protein